MTSTIIFDANRRKQLQTAYDQAISRPHNRNDTFTVEIEGHGKREFVIGYAGYTLEYLDTVMGKPAEHFPPNREGEEGQ